MKNKSILFLLFTCCVIHTQIDVIIFSYNRPIFLYALIESIMKNTTGIGNIYVLHQEIFEYTHYTRIFEDFFPNVIMVNCWKYSEKNMPHILKKLCLETDCEGVVLTTDNFVVNKQMNINNFLTMINSESIDVISLTTDHDVTSSHLNSDLFLSMKLYSKKFLEKIWGQIEIKKQPDGSYSPNLQGNKSLKCSIKNVNSAIVIISPFSIDNLEQKFSSNMKIKLGSCESLNKLELCEQSFITRTNR